MDPTQILLQTILKVSAKMTISKSHELKHENKRIIDDRRISVLNIPKIGQNHRDNIQVVLEVDFQSKVSKRKKKVSKLSFEQAKKQK